MRNGGAGDRKCEKPQRETREGGVVCMFAVHRYFLSIQGDASHRPHPVAQASAHRRARAESQFDERPNVLPGDRDNVKRLRSVLLRGWQRVKFIVQWRAQSVLVIREMEQSN